MTLYHYTHPEAAEKIAASGLVLPGRDVGMISPLSWFTDMEIPDRNALGLTMHFLTIDRTARRFRVVDDTWVKPWRDLRRKFPPRYLDQLEASPGALLMHWWVAARPIPVVPDPRPEEPTG
ncbi:hypothetical protein [Brachybacterium hainanense]|uniref:DUF4433 domain-containing protein n=1 Tax=Brachybacterium hainanense TaxID=1541174 RepID=A0ABV6R944_9MICO